MRKLILLLCTISSLSAFAETLTLDGYISAGGDHGATTFTTKTLELNLGERYGKQSQDMEKIFDNANCEDQTLVDKPVYNCRIKAQLNKSKTAIIKLISAEKIN